MILLLTGMMTFYAVRHFIVEPMRRLQRSAQLIGKGEPATDLDFKSNDEIGALATTLKVMDEDLRRPRSGLNIWPLRHVDGITEPRQVY
ncbi:HAMP domain-containing protein [Candidatus Reidiella endopervernicosa]|uniref:HAMP domain-containing protein n=1 Tax=Candidatus Reidiella endopervernicosa TaxID=2738883 RepID=A0A6N0HS86_9GAMM|nr:HAMP domain-containing protein [Candidatus Reidiella endopervernicosa]QKQ25198.1 HAMP domain-containing protein [Candidatus Reidiella endopervernicosa]